MVRPWILDAIFIALMLIAFLYGRHRGIVRMLWGLLAWLIAVVLALTLAQPFREMAEKSPIAESLRVQAVQTIEGKLKEAVNSGASSAVELYNGIPKMFIPKDAAVPAALNDGTEKFVSDISGQIAGNAVKIITGAVSFLLLLVLIRLGLAIVFRILNTASKLPVINGTNRLLGGLMGIAGMLLIIYMILAYISLFIAGDYGLVISRTNIVRYFYNNNILLLLSGR